MTSTIEFTLNGSNRAVEIEDGVSLLEVLRDDCGLISPKDGCSPTGQCGCCTVIVDGRAVVSCSTPAKAVGGKTSIRLKDSASESAKHLPIASPPAEDCSAPSARPA